MPKVMDRDTPSAEKDMMGRKRTVGRVLQRKLRNPVTPFRKGRWTPLVSRGPRGFTKITLHHVGN
jgi:hypothetical protein